MYTWYVVLNMMIDQVCTHESVSQTNEHVVSMRHNIYYIYNLPNKTVIEMPKNYIDTWSKARKCIEQKTKQVGAMLATTQA